LVSLKEKKAAPTEQAPALNPQAEAMNEKFLPTNCQAVPLNLKAEIHPEPSQVSDTFSKPAG
jgi:hypothetical protein